MIKINTSRILLTIKKHKLLCAIFLGGFALRLFFWAFVVYHNTVPIFDEASYFWIGSRYDVLADELTSGHLPERYQLKSAYCEGLRPPLIGALYGAAIFVSFSDDPLVQVACVRMLNVLASSATILVLYMLTKRLVNRRAALIGAVFFAFYPSFIAFSHYLWVEPLYTLFLLLSIYFFIRSEENHRLVLLSGLFLGCAGLVHARTLLLFVLFPTWIVYKDRSQQGFKRAALILIVIVLVVGPWIMVLYNRTGKLLPLSNQGGRALYNGNNPLSHLAIGSSGRDSSAAFAFAYDYADEHNMTFDDVTRLLAWREIKGDLPLFFLRSLGRLRVLWSHDTYVLRYILIGYYPPMSIPAVYFYWGLSILAYLILLFSAFRGIMSGGFQRVDHVLFLMLVILFNCALPMISVAYTRYNLPNLVLLLPFAGAGWAVQRQWTVRRFVAQIMFAGFAIWVVFSTLQPTFEHHIQYVAPEHPVEARYDDIVNLFE